MRGNKSRPAVVPVTQLMVCHIYKLLTVAVVALDDVRRILVAVLPRSA